MVLMIRVHFTISLFYIELTLFSDWPKAYSEFLKSATVASFLQIIQ